MEARDHKPKLLMLCLLMAITIPVLKANIGEYDEVWQQREIEADQSAKEAYRDDPIEITDHFNKAVHDHLEGTNDTRRNLRHKYDGPCMVTNPMDACWRCDPNWEQNRQKLADCALGFARGTTGGKGGPIYIVKEPGDKDPLNPKPGTLRHAAIQPGPLWITFSKSMKITLKQELMLTSDKTIDARGHNVHVEGGCQITLQYVRNIIISNLHVRDNVPCKGGLVRDSWNHIGVRTGSDGDGISLFGASRVWIDHVSGSKCADGIIDAIAGSTAITISNSHFTNHNDVMLFGSSDTFVKDEVMQITLAFNHFGQGLIQRMPRCRFGFFHVVNNDYTHWIMYAIGGSSHPTILSQGNRYIAPNQYAAKEICNRVHTGPAVWRNWNWRSEGDLMVNGARFTESGTPIHSVPMVNLIPAKPGTMVTKLTRFSGPLKCHKGKPC